MEKIYFCQLISELIQFNFQRSFLIVIFANICVDFANGSLSSRPYDDCMGFAICDSSSLLTCQWPLLFM